MAIKTFPRQQRDISLSLLKNAPHNPDRRLKDDRMKALVASMKEIGLLYPILITKDFEIIDGHRRVAAARQLAWSTIAAVVIEGDRDKVYRSVNQTAAKMTGNDLLGVWLKNPNAVPDLPCRRLERMREVLGLDLMQEMYQAGYSVRLYQRAVYIADYCEAANNETVIAIVKWLMEFPVLGKVLEAIHAGERPALILKAIREKRPIRMRLSLDN
jgi:hypothetical protein